MLQWRGTIEPDISLPLFITAPGLRQIVADQFLGMIKEIERRSALPAKSPPELTAIAVNRGLFCAALEVLPAHRLRRGCSRYRGFGGAAGVAPDGLPPRRGGRSQGGTRRRRLPNTRDFLIFGPTDFRRRFGCEVEDDPAAFAAWVDRLEGSRRDGAEL